MRCFVRWLGQSRCIPVSLLSVNPADQHQRVCDFISSRTQPVLIIGYEMYRKHADTLRDIDSPLLICDEGHRLKSITDNKTIRSLNKLHTQMRIMLTGTPIQNAIHEFYAMCNFVNPYKLPSLKTFTNTFSRDINKSRDANATLAEKALGQERSEQLANLTKEFVLRRSNDILLQFLPKKVETVLFIPLSTLQSSLYEFLLKTKAIRQVVNTGLGNDANSLRAILNLKKLVNHPALIYDECEELSRELRSDPVSSPMFNAGSNNNPLALFPQDYSAQEAAADLEQSTKFFVLDHLLSEIHRENSKVVIVSNYIQTLDVLAHYLRSRQWPFLKLDGNTPTQERTAIVDRFNGSYDKSFVFLLSAKAGGVRATHLCATV